MNLWPFGRRDAAPAAVRARDFNEVIKALDGSHGTKVGAKVTTQTALQVATVLACARVLAEGVAQVPLKVYRESADGRSKAAAKDHPAYNILWRRPNEWMTSFEFRETMMYHTALAGNAYAFKNEVDGQLAELIPFMPNQVRVVQGEHYTLTYEIRVDGQLIGVYPRERMLHTRGPSWGGAVGMDVITLAREAIGLTMAIEESQGALYKHGGRPPGIITTDNTIDPAVVERVRESWQAIYGGPSNRGKVPVLDSGLKYMSMAMTGEDAQTIDNRKFQIEEICRALRVFPQMVMHTDKTSTYASAEQFFIAHVIHSLGPWFERLEQVYDRDLLDGPGELFAKHNVAGLLRGDAKSRAEYYKSGINDGWMTRNEARSFEDMDALDGLDKPLVPMNMTGADNAEDDPPEVE